MARIGVAIIKKAAFRGSVQHFSNVYFYERPTIGTALEWTSVVNDIVSNERNLHSTAVTFVRARLWSAGGTQAENTMLHEQTLTGTGNLPTVAAMDRERAFLVRWPAGKDIRGKPVFLRKWYHACGYPAGFTIQDGILSQLDALPTAVRDSVASTANGTKRVGPTADTWTLCSKRGRNVQGDAQCHRFLEHHQLGDEWR